MNHFNREGRQDKKHRLDLTTYEKLKEALSEKINFTYSDVERFWIANKGDFDATLNHIMETLNWRKEVEYDNIHNEDFSDVLKTGELFFHKTALDGSTVLVWRSCKHIPGLIQRSREARFFLWMMAKAERADLIKNKFTLLFDRTMATRANADLGLAREILPMLQRHFPECLERVLVYPTSLFLNTLWCCVKPFLDPMVRQKIYFWKEHDYLENIRRFVEFDQFQWNQLERHNDPTGIDTVLAK
ncbi:CRAL/TRIO domain-containing protein [Basidiobolus meristosporus CBS 931.73]|uniref:CRAL/TRIO domain-containing protein n=1 Tax=Basidiobolus meristosporus CBS 931.73 TaxID=1314790 RepID=A0A1Y1Y2K6_9FUNG|nr:CRAL/TRIO domain-containing protein [Basidiobolus meristosporus CBS 931.73]|eukprot:ORX92233.1 CRAL/TRIO domain-containing protein [Basidiobolus meristosporus CBS 931.73]